MTFAPGQIVGERYRMVGEIASGGMGSVYRVERVKDGRPFAFKVIRRDLSPGAETIARFRREARVLEQVSHEGVVEMVDAGLLRDGSAFLVMELLEGETLLDFLRRESPVTAGELVPIVKGIARALDAVHALGVVHRDLKPSNVFLTKDGVKLVDFGIAYATNATRLTMTGHVVGTLRYMAPEQLRGEAIDSRTDIYALGVIVWGALAGGPPFEGTGMNAAKEIFEGVPRVDRQVPGLPKAVGDVVAKVTALRRDARYTSAGAFTDAFGRVAADAPTERPGGATGFLPIPSTRTGVTRVRPPVRAVSLPDDPPTNESIRAERRRARAVRTTVGVATAVLAAVVLLMLLGSRIGRRDAEGPPEDNVPSAMAASDPEPVGPVPTPAGARTILITSQPTGARVFDGDAALGVTPLTIEAPDEGEPNRVLTLSLAGREPSSIGVGPFTADTVVVPLREETRSATRRRSTETTRRRSAERLPLPTNTTPAPGTAMRRGTDVVDPWSSD